MKERGEDERETPKRRQPPPSTEEGLYRHQGTPAPALLQAAIRLQRSRLTTRRNEYKKYVESPDASGEDKVRHEQVGGWYHTRRKHGRGRTENKGSREAASYMHEPSSCTWPAAAAVGRRHRTTNDEKEHKGTKKEKGQETTWVQRHSKSPSPLARHRLRIAW